MHDETIEQTFQALWRAQDPQRSALLEQVQALAKSNDEALGHLAYYHLQRDEFAPATRLYRELVRRRPDDDEALRLLAQAALGAGRPRLARWAYRRMLRGKRLGYDELAQIELAAGDAAGSSPWAELVSPRSWRELGRLALQPGVTLRMAAELARLLPYRRHLKELRPLHWYAYLRNYAQTTHAWPVIPCDLCGRQAHRTIYFNDWNRIVECIHCNLERVLRAPPRGFEAAQGLYDSQPSIEGLSRFWDGPAWRAGREETLNALLAQDEARWMEAASQPPLAFEIGAGRGDMLVVLRDRGWRVDGIEVGRHFVDRARALHGLELRQGTLDDVMTMPPGTMDLVLAFHVIEHLDRPSQLFEAARHLLKPTGALLMETPITKFRELDYAHRRDPDFGYFVCGHSYFFHEETLRSFFPRCGFELLGARTYVSSQQFRNMACYGKPLPV